MNKVIVGLVVVLVIVGVYVVIRGGGDQLVHVDETIAATGEIGGDEPVLEQQAGPPLDVTPDATNVVSGDSDDEPDIVPPNFTLPQHGGGEITLSDYFGDKPVVLDFWASWCHNCQRDMPKMSALYSEYSDRVEFIGVNLQENESTVSRFQEKYDINFPLVYDEDGTTAQDYFIRYTNTHIYIGRDGFVKEIIPGDIDESQIKNLLE